jgi:mannose-6-phosphate isomerase-like protein (cupin superfamily)
MMNAVAIQTVLQSLGKLDITDRTTSQDAGAAIEMLGDFNQCMVGLVCFSGATPWERHPNAEFLHVQEGAVMLTLLAEDGVRQLNLQAGSMFIVPASLWHKQFSRDGVKLLFITSREGNEDSTAEDPRLTKT